MALHALQARQQWQRPHLDSTTHTVCENMTLHALQARQQWQGPHLDSTTLYMKTWHAVQATMATSSFR